MRRAFLGPLASLGDLAFAMGLSPPLVLGRRDHRRASTIHLDHENFAVTVRRRRLFDKRPCLAAHRIDHAKRGTRARRPLMELLEGLSRLRKSQHRGQTCDRNDCAETETTAQSELAIDGQVNLLARPIQRLADGSLEGNLAESCAELRDALFASQPEASSARAVF